MKLLNRPESTSLANEKRVKEIKLYQRELARARQIPRPTLKASRPNRKSKRTQSSKTQETGGIMGKVHGGPEKCWNPPVEELQATGKDSVAGWSEEGGKGTKRPGEFNESRKQPILMKRKYLNYLSTEIVPNLVTPDNLDAKIQEAVDGAEVSGAEGVKSQGNSYNVTAETVVECEKEVKRKLKEIRVPM